MERKKTSLFILGLSILLLSVVGVTYAFWELRLSQMDNDTLASSCFKVTLTDEKNPISLQKAFPISDEEGEELTPYEFTITNICPTSLTYQVNLETLQLEEEQKLLPEKYLKVQLDDRTPLVLSDYESVKETLENATKSHRLTTGILDGQNQSVTYHLRLWLDEETPPIEEVMNAYFKSKITVVATYKTTEQLENNIILSANSNTAEYNEKSESITLKAVSEKYKLIEYKISQMQETQNWKPISDKNTTFEITEDFTKLGKYYFSVKDEMGNIKEKEFEVTKIDTVGPDIKYEQKDNHTSVELTITLKDSQSGLVKYQITKEDLTPIMLLSESTPAPPSEWESVEKTQNDYIVNQTIEDNGIYYIFAQDALGHTSSMKYSTDIIDKKPPTITLTNDLTAWGESDKIHINLSDEKAGLFGYQVMTEAKDPETWITIDGNPKSYNADYPVTENGTYYVYAKDAYNNVTHSSIQISYIDVTPPTVDLQLSSNGNTILADASKSADQETRIQSYEYKIDEGNWENGENSHKFSVIPCENYTITVKVTDESGNANETSKTILVSPIKNVPIVTEGNGLYMVEHSDISIEFWKKNECRYAGDNYTDSSTDYVHNYLTFNNELWRIIGLVNVQTSTGTTEKRFKIISNDSIGNRQWDSDSSHTDWTDSDLMRYLNETYYSTLSDTNMIDEEIIWDTGAIMGYGYDNTPTFYKWERSNIIPNKASTSYWTRENTKDANGELDQNLFHSIAVMYPSDYGYAAGGAVRDSCLETDLSDYNTSCEEHDWLYSTDISDNVWMLSVSYFFSGNAYVFQMTNTGFVHCSYPSYKGYGPNHSNAIRPTLYLKQNVQIKDNGKDGSYENPYELELVE